MRVRPLGQVSQLRYHRRGRHFGFVSCCKLSRCSRCSGGLLWLWRVKPRQRCYWRGLVFCHSCVTEGDSVLSVALLTEETDFQWIWNVSCVTEGDSVLSVALLTEETDFQWIWNVSCGTEGDSVLSVALLTEETDFQWIWYVSCGIEGDSVLSVALPTEETDFQWICQRWYWRG